ncbi:amino acid ABC transporter substrate-binding protein (PAAT family) [Paraburkholderia sp. BL18I3N2]|uniref:ectoine/hydroxyectoine ABC transporter substrate-binding protein EhuB n=1 Tax=unclassified Paraburkholderia TaxID=2615204 RepID=UPI000D075B39|nr:MULTISPECIES: ectoine/hydroxyectoine ABC transporter substrate-binding protein EhuB [unclassified Paraburkholderia]PRX19633.1 amino acid ABC transporter substrate-binding protein (PAAT family) [Paraburkholderia sp. BL18I3N2]PRX95920.1 amino acid ABC transporter substrate-binding protein (PAAT family) [Paraburkholderia sp. BL25I1N1]TDY15652.1 amino acid ABC transporter substrate-binding protein (PAAT family) [Paraburkholderia sp. BL6665CI2N2]
MRLRKVFNTVAVVAALFGAQAVHAQGVLSKAKETGTIRVGIFNQAPWGYVDANRDVKGQTVDILKAAFAPLGITKIDAVVTDFGALIPGLLSKRFDVIAAGLYIKPERCKLVAFGNPDIQMSDALLVHKGNPKYLHSYADIAKDKSVTLSTGRGNVEYQHAIDAGIPKERISAFTDNDTELAALTTGRADAVVETAATVSVWAKASGNIERALPFAQPVSADGRTLYGYPALAFRPADADFRDAYNAELKKLRKSGKMLEILKQYGFSETDLPPENLTAADLCK